MGAAVHRPGLSGDRMAKAESSWFGVVTALGTTVHRPGLSGDRLDMAESSSARVVTGRDFVHRPWHGGAPSLAVRCHRRYLTEAGTCWS